MDGVALWEVTMGEEGMEMTSVADFGQEEFKFRQFPVPSDGPRVVRSAAEERGEKGHKVKSDYLVGVAPSLGVSKAGLPMVGVGTNEYVTA